MRIPPGLPPSKRSRSLGSNGPHRTRHEELQQLVLDCESLIRAQYDRGYHQGDVIVLADMDREETVNQIVSQWGRDLVDLTFRECRAAGRRPMLTYIQDTRLVEGMASSSDFAHRETSKELRRFQGHYRLGFIPLLVLIPGGLWATLWAMPGSKTNVIRYEPVVPVEAN